ncbi:hypothetical protein L1887_36049 [Cichorium endivia]|nr:hypothetical protein L1887_36049 [Cichorium endivia]
MWKCVGETIPLKLEFRKMAVGALRYILRHCDPIQTVSWKKEKSLEMRIYSNWRKLDFEWGIKRGGGNNDTNAGGDMYKEIDEDIEVSEGSSPDNDQPNLENLIGGGPAGGSEMRDIGLNEDGTFCEADNHGPASSNVERSLKKGVLDLNVEASANSFSSFSRNKSKAEMSKGKLALLVRFKDIFFDPRFMKRRNKDIGSKVYCSRDSKSFSFSSSSMNSTSVEILKTMEVGNEIGFQMDGSECAVRSVIEGVGAIHSKK